MYSKLAIACKIKTTYSYENIYFIAPTYTSMYVPNTNKRTTMIDECAIGLSDICRLCAIESESGIDVFSAHGESLNLEEKIDTCLQIKVSSSDHLPKNVCTTCVTMLDELHQFFCRATNAQQTLAFLYDQYFKKMPEGDSAFKSIKLEGNCIKNESEDLTITFNNDLNDMMCESLPDLNFLSAVESMELSPNLSNLYTPSYEKDTLFLKVSESICDLNKSTRSCIESSSQILQANGSDEIVVSTSASSRITTRISDASGLILSPVVNHTKEPLAETDSDVAVVDETQSAEKQSGVQDESGFKKESGDAKAFRDWGLACPTCRHVFSFRTDFEDHCQKAHNEIPIYACSRCDKRLDNFHSYRTHYYRHTFKFPCSYCEKAFTLEGALRAHVLARHVSVRPFTCEKCRKSYVTQARLDEHNKQHDMEPSQFSCVECQKVLQTRKGLKVHMTTHRFGRRFQCDLCGKTFTQKVNMQQHVKCHKGERPFSCNQCDKRFSEKSHLKRHMSYHSKERPFECTICKKSFKTEGCLKAHGQIHEETKPCTCSECGKSFRNISKLKRHFNCHSKEKIFSCKHCQVNFSNLPNLLKHRRRFHKIEHKSDMQLKEESIAQSAQLSQAGSFVEFDFLNLPPLKVKDDGLLFGTESTSQDLIWSEFNVSNVSDLSSLNYLTSLDSVGANS